ncbi:hypothetical protein F0562_034166 [Nyssa sinensis]|uniref:Uncharacterized protein n=1 Tax=Nyssa sinensis TaxID=561372 RepID=A0A5J5AHM9_9ASTE|nr:hypothetical protein F0562_034166 [Nyssa sinensis]
MRCEHQTDLLANRNQAIKLKKHESDPNLSNIKLEEQRKTENERKLAEKERRKRSLTLPTVSQALRLSANDDYVPVIQSLSRVLTFKTDWF